MEENIMKMRKIDCVVVAICAVAAILCGINHPLSAPTFVLSSTIGLNDAMKNKVLPSALINGIFLILNVVSCIRNFA